MEYPVVKIEEKHLADLSELEKACFPHAWDFEQFQTALHDNYTELFGIENAKGKIIAYLLCSVIGDYAEILNIATHEQYRQKRLGSKLLAYWLEQEHIVKCQIILEVRAKNIPAQKLYAKFGFKQIHIRKNYYEDDDALVMQR